MLNTAGLLEGLDVMTRSFQDTKIIKYLATNSTAGNVLSLKASAHEFAGNWAVEEIKDIRKVPLRYAITVQLGRCTIYELCEGEILSNHGSRFSDKRSYIKDYS